MTSHSDREGKPRDLRRLAERPPQPRENIRGGKGRAEAVDYFTAGEMAGVQAVSRVTLAAGASVGDHPHPDQEELYLILEGEGEGALDGEAFPVGPGDAFLCRAGHAHGLSNTGGTPLVFLAVLTRPGS